LFCVPQKFSKFLAWLRSTDQSAQEKVAFSEKLLKNEKNKISLNSDESFGEKCRKSAFFCDFEAQENFQSPQSPFLIVKKL
jgi:hypothetical protein